jgi:hypothetical protein
MQDYLEKTFGLYETNNKFFFKKVDAVLESSKTGSDVAWHYNDKIFPSLDWKNEPTESLDVLYRKRAQQIRDEYDYVIIMASGGADSTNVLYSFLDNNIHIDEIIASAPITGLEKFHLIEHNISAENTVAETILAQMPLLKTISHLYPNIKITINDYFDTLLNYKDESWLSMGSLWLHPSAARHDLSNLPHIRKLAESGKKIAKVYGIDKPILARGVSGKFYNCIFDGSIQVANHSSLNGMIDTITPVLFYITPDMPEVMIKQAHNLARWMHSDPGLYAKYSRMTLLDKASPESWRTNPKRYGTHHRAIISGIYPRLNDFKIWQAFKSTITNGLDPMEIVFDKWMTSLYRDEIVIEKLNSDIKNMFGSSPTDWFTKTQSLCLKYYEIGHESQFAGDPSFLDRSFDYSFELKEAIDYVYATS